MYSYGIKIKGMKTILKNAGFWVYFYWMYFFRKKELNRRIDLFANSLVKAFSNAIADIPLFNPMIDPK